MAEDNAEKDGAYDDEIIYLLHQVGQRLLRSEHERKEFKHMLADLENKTSQGERAYLTVQDKLHKTESAIEKRQNALEKTQDAMEKTQKSQEERLEKATAMTDKIEEAISQHSRINRRLDKAAQDKARMIRKLERIEDAVTETQDAMNSKALLLLTDQNIACKNASLQATATGKTEAQEQNNTSWWHKNTPVRAAAVTAMIMLGIFGGWTINQVQIQTPFLGTGTRNETIAYNTAPAPPPSFSDLSAYDEAPEAQAAMDISPFVETPDTPLAETTEKPEKTQKIARASVKKSVSPQTVKPAPNSNSVALTKKQKQEADPMALDDERLLANLNKNPGAVAAKLNEIAPAAGLPSENLSKNAPKPETKAKNASFRSQKTKDQRIKKQMPKETTTAEFLNSQRSSVPLKDRISPDPDLPPVIKEVEKKAFEGMAEAQHDLAAIYTAGHGSVNVNFEKSALWFRESALQGIANARYNLGVLYHQGLGVTKDINMAVNWYRAAAELGHPEAQYNLGIAYIEGVGTKYDPKKAAYYFEKSAKGDILEAAYNLGLIYENGLMGAPKPDTALYWYKQASEMGSPEAKVAMNQLAKTSGISPEDLDRLYSKVKKEEDSHNKSSQKEKPQKTASNNNDNSNIDYIEAEPLFPEQTVTEKEETLEKAKTVTNPYAVIAQIQEQLIRVGLYPGPADGVSDTLTEDAIRSYQAHYDLKQDGHPSEALLVHMMTSDLESSREQASRAE